MIFLNRVYGKTDATRMTTMVRQEFDVKYRLR